MPYSPDIQERNPEMVGILSADFRRRYEANYAIADAISAYLALPGLRGFWPFSAVSTGAAVVDLQGSGLTLTRSGGALIYGSGLAPSTILDGTGDCWYHADHAQYDITGTEGYFQNVFKGLTLGAWVYPTALDVESRYIISKWSGVAAADSYVLNYSIGDDNFKFYIRDSAGPTAGFVDFNSASTINGWYFVAARFNPNTALTIWVNGESVSKATTLLDVQNSNSNFVIGAHHSLADNEWTGHIAFPFITSTSLRDSTVFNLYQLTRPIFGV